MVRRVVGATQFAVEPVDENTRLLWVAGELHLGNTPELQAQIRAAVERAHCALVIDLTLVEFMDSTALAALLTARKQLRGRLALVVNDDSAVNRLFALLDMGRVVTIAATREDAIDALRQPKRG